MAHLHHRSVDLINDPCLSNPTVPTHQHELGRWCGLQAFTVDKGFRDPCESREKLIYLWYMCEKELRARMEKSCRWKSKEHLFLTSIQLLAHVELAEDIRLANLVPEGGKAWTYRGWYG